MPARPVDPQAERPSSNEVHLVGRVTSPPEERVLPSGTVIVTSRMSMRRAAMARDRSTRQTSDWVDCVAFGARARRAMATWSIGDVVTVDGALRRRFYRAGDSAATRLEVEVLRAARVRA